MLHGIERTSGRWEGIFFRGAAIYGVLLMLPLYATEWIMRLQGATPLAHPEFLYGFVGVTLCSQLIYWIIGGSPARYRALMPVAVLAKLSFFIPSMGLWCVGRISGPVPLAACMDGILACIFFAAWRQTRPPDRVHAINHRMAISGTRDGPNCAGGDK